MTKDDQMPPTFRSLVTDASRLGFTARDALRGAVTLVGDKRPGKRRRRARDDDPGSLPTVENPPPSTSGGKTINMPPPEGTLT